MIEVPSNSDFLLFLIFSNNKVQDLKSLGQGLNKENSNNIEEHNINLQELFRRANNYFEDNKEVLILLGINNSNQLVERLLEVYDMSIKE